MRIGTVLVALVALAGCKARVDDGYAIDLPVVFDVSVTDEQIAGLARLHLDASGAEVFATDLDPRAKFSGRSSALRYKPGRTTTGTLTLALTAFDSGDVAFAAGSVEIVLQVGKTQTQPLTLYGSGNGSDGGSGDDLGLLPDLNPCGNGVLDAGESCDDGPGSGRPCPHAAADCDDKNPCTTDSLVGTQCQAACKHVALTDGSGCTAAGATGVCNKGACCSGCVSASGACLAGSADAKACGSAGNACFDCTINSATATCNSGQCSGCDATSCTTDMRSCGTSSCGFNCGSCGDTCSGGMLTHHACSLKACQPNGTTSCTPYVGCATASTCAAACNGDVDCVSGDFCCVSGMSCFATTPKQCLTKYSNSACTSGNQCMTGNCIDGYCCNSTCGGQCEACNVAGKQGTCSPVSGAPVAPRTPCTSDGSSCGGACNGTATASCAFPASGAGCNDGNACTYGDVCDGGGRCGGTAINCTSDACTNFSCNGTSTCSSSPKPAGTICGACHCGNLGCDGAGSCNRQMGCVPSGSQCP